MVTFKKIMGAVLVCALLLGGLGLSGAGIGASRPETCIKSQNGAAWCLSPWLERKTLSFFMDAVRPLFSAKFRRPYDSVWRLLDALGRSVVFSFIEERYERDGGAYGQLMEFKEYLFVFIFDLVGFAEFEDFFSNPDCRDLYMLAIYLDRMDAYAKKNGKVGDLSAALEGCPDKVRFWKMLNRVRKVLDKNARSLFGPVWDERFCAYFGGLVETVGNMLPPKVRNGREADVSVSDDFCVYLGALFANVSESLSLTSEWGIQHAPFGLKLEYEEPAMRGPVWTVRYWNNGRSDPSYLFYDTRPAGDTGVDMLSVEGIEISLVPQQILMLGLGNARTGLVYNNLAAKQPRWDWLSAVPYETVLASAA